MFLTWILIKHIQEHIDKQRFVSGQELYSATYIWYKLAFDKKKYETSQNGVSYNIK